MTIHPKGVGSIMHTELILQILLTSVGFLLVFNIQTASAHLEELKESVKDLNVKIAVVIERVDSHERRISNLEEK